MNQTWYSLFPLHQLYTCALLRRGRTIFTVSKKIAKKAMLLLQRAFASIQYLAQENNLELMWML